MNKTWLVMKICKDKEREIGRRDINRKRSEENKELKQPEKNGIKNT